MGTPFSPKLASSIFCGSVVALASGLLLAGSKAHSQNHIGQGAVATQFASLCADCHNAAANGGSMIGGRWKYGGKPEQLARNIKLGIPSAGMPAFADLSDADIHALVVFLEERRSLAQTPKEPTLTLPPDTGRFAGGEGFVIEEVALLAGTAWAIEGVPGSVNEYLVSVREGRLYRLAGKGELRRIEGLPAIAAFGQGGLLDVIPSPDFELTKEIYFAFSKSGAKDNPESPKAMTAVAKARLEGVTLTGCRVIFSAPPDTHKSSGAHFGTRLAFDGKGHLFFGIGDRGSQNDAQDLSLPNGKIHRVHLDGSIPSDNPFISHANAMPSIWSYGHRNPQGLTFDPISNLLLELEHGPRGGDELNVIRRGGNYGWPLVTYGINYSGSPITDRTELDGTLQPATYWVPSLAVSTVEIYRKDAFPNWRDKILVAGLASQELRLLTMIDDQVLDQQLLLKDAGRIRDVHIENDGAILLILNLSNDDRPLSKIVRLRPLEPAFVSLVSPGFRKRPYDYEPTRTD